MFTVQGLNNGHDPINFDDEFATVDQAVEFIRTRPNSYASARIYDNVGLYAIWTVTGNKIFYI